MATTPDGAPTVGGTTRTTGATAHPPAPDGSGTSRLAAFPLWGGRTWRPWHVVLGAATYWLLSWMAVGYEFYNRKHGVNLITIPWTSIPIAIGLSAAAFGALWLVVLRRRSGGALDRVVDALALLGMVAVMVAAYKVFGDFAPYYSRVTDRHTALQVGWTELMAGHNPYYGRTQLGNSISPMLGGIILAGPLMLLKGNLWWHGLLWLAGLMAFLSALCGPRAGFVAGSLLIFSPTIRLELGSLQDGWSNGAALAVTATLLYLLAGRAGRSRAWTTAYVGAALLFSLAFSYRFIYAVIALPLIVLLWRRYGLRTMLLAAVPAAVASALLIFVPWALDPAAYAPFTKASLGTTARTVPGLPIITGVACVLVTVVGTVAMRTLAGLWGTMTAVSVVLIVLTGWGQHEWYQYLTYAYSGAALVFAIFALVLPLREPYGEADGTTAPGDGGTHGSLWDAWRARRGATVG